MAFRGRACDDPAMAWLMILAGLGVLGIGAEALVRGAAWIAEALGVRPLIVGLTVVAIGTSAPELVVSVIAANKGETGLVIGNVFGSNTANLALILGLTAFVRPIDASDSKMRFEILWLLAASLLTFAAFLGDEFSRQLGVAMTTMIVVFLIWVVLRERPGRPKETSQDKTVISGIAHLAMTAAGGLGLYYGGQWLVDGAITVARDLGMSPPVIGATIVAIGTSLPELAASIVAARRGHPEMAVGNIVGSNVFNILLVLGVTATISPIPVGWAEHGIRMLVPMVLTVYVAFLLLRNMRIMKPAGMILLISYVWYIIWEILLA
ncbi:MAG: calcium/sodium antiporter [Planctomycetota bacterium]|nr:calcium/sodium antiporter [Planctomycetota bacterium]